MKTNHIFCYIRRNSPIHRSDPRLKLIITLFLGVFGSCFTNYAIYIAWTSLLLIIMFSAKIPLKSLFSNTLSLLLLCSVVLIAQKFNSAGIIYCWRLFLLLLGGNLLIQTTTLSELRCAIKKLLKPVPGINEEHLAILFTLTFMMIPMIFEEVEHINESAKARCLENNKNPLTRVLSLAYPLLMQIIRRAAEISDALETRGFNY